MQLEDIISRFCEFYHKRLGDNFCHETIELEKSSGSMYAMAFSCGLICSAYNIFGIAEGENIKGFALAAYAGNIKKFGVQRAGANGGDTDFSGLQLFLKSTAECGNIALRGAINRHSGVGTEGSYRAHIDNAPAIDDIGNRNGGDGSESADIKVNHTGLHLIIRIAYVCKITAACVIDKERNFGLFFFEKSLEFICVSLAAKVERHYFSLGLFEELGGGSKLIHRTGNKPNALYFGEKFLQLSNKLKTKTGGGAGYYCGLHAYLCLDGFGILNVEGLDGDLCHSLRLNGLVTPAAASLGDAVNNFHTLGYLAESGILAVKIGSGFVHDEELAACGVGIHCASHGENAGSVLEVIFETVGGEFALDAVAGATHAVAVGAAALNHETGNDTMEDLVIIETLIDEGDEVVNSVGSEFGIELSLDDVAVFHFDGYVGIHNVPPDLSKVFKCSVNISVCLTFGLALALVIELFTFAKANFNLNAAILEIDGKGNEGCAILHNLGVELQNLLLMHKKLAGTDGVAVKNVALFIGAYMHAADKYLSVLYGAEGVLEIQCACADGLNLGAEKLDAGLIALKYKIIMKGFSVGGSLLNALSLG